MDCVRFGPEVAAEAAGRISKRATTFRRLRQVGMRMVMVVAAVAALNASVVYAGEYECHESSSPPSDNQSGNPGDPNNSESYSGGFGTNWSDQDQNDHSAQTKLTIGG